MIKIQTDEAEKFADPENLKRAKRKAADSRRQVTEGTGPGSEWLGWRRILKAPNDAELEKIDRKAAGIRQDADIFIVCGIGGSYLGARAVIEALHGLIPDQKPEIIFTGHHMGGNYLRQLLTYLDQPGEDGEPKNVYLNVISKSGSTLETALAFRVLRQWMEKRYGEDASRRIIATTGPEGGVLNRLVNEYGYEKFVIPDDVGGRFSVLTPVGLLPIAVSGIDIQTLFYGAVTKFEAYEKNADDVETYAALRYCFHEAGKELDVIGSFEPELNAFSGWIQQLLGESEGKKGKGIFPVPAAYSTDLHSVGQMIQQGKRNMIETFLVVREPLNKFIVPSASTDEDGLHYLNNVSFHQINQKALQGTIEAHLSGGVPVFRVIMEKLNEQNLGELIYFYELFTAIYVYMLNVNPFNQPGVEDYKKAMYRNLGKE